MSCSGGWCGVWSGGVVCGSVGGGGPAGRLPGCLVVPVVWWSRLSGGVSGAGVVVEWLSPRRGWGPLVGFPAPCGGWCVVRRSPTLPHAPACSTIGAGRLNFRVRYGTGCFPSAMATGTVSDTGRRSPLAGVSCPCVQNNTVDASTSSHGPAPLFVGRGAWGKPLGRLGSVSSTPRGASTSDPSTRWSAGGLTSTGLGNPHLEACFPLRCFQRLSLPNVANQPCSWRNNWHTRGWSVPVLSY